MNLDRDPVVPRKPSILETDWYKMFMAWVGYPLREETFVFQMRRGGPYVMPVDPVEYVNSLLPTVRQSDLSYIEEQGFPMGPAYVQAMKGSVKVIGVPKGRWFSANDPVLTVTGPSALVSYLEAKLTMLRFRIQTATIALIEPETLQYHFSTVTCDREREIVLETLDTVNVEIEFKIKVDRQGYYDHIYARAKELVDAVGSGKVLEAGLRAASCMEQHLIALSACQAAGFEATSNVYGAMRLGMTPRGTTGHEHHQRCGIGEDPDYEAFTTARDRAAGVPTFLLDTISTQDSGIPAATKAMAEARDRLCAVRFDSEDTMVEDYAAAILMFMGFRLSPVLNLGGGFNLKTTQKFEQMRRALLWPENRQSYMYGQYAVEPPFPLPTRSEASAVWKLCRTGSRDTMKFSDNKVDPKVAGPKSSLPGLSRLFRKVDPSVEGPHSYIAQHGEKLPPGGGYEVLSGGREGSFYQGIPEGLEGPSEHSPATKHLISVLTHERNGIRAGSATRTLSLLTTQG